MSFEFKEARSALDALLKDEGRRLRQDEKDIIIKEAVNEFSRFIPKKTAAEESGDGGFDYDLPSDYVEGFSSITELVFPNNSSIPDPPILEPKQYKIATTPSGDKLRFLEHEPASTQTYIIGYTVPHTVQEEDTVTAGNLTAAGTEVSGATNSSEVQTDAVRHARIFAYITAITGTLDIFVETSEDQSRWVRIGQFPTINAIGDYILPLEKEKISKYIRLAYAPAGGSTTLETEIESRTPGLISIPRHALLAFSYLTASIASGALADYYAQTTPSNLDGDTVDYQGKSSFWKTQADHWNAKWEEQRSKLTPPVGVSASAQGEWDLKGSLGQQPLIHSPRYR